MTNEQAQKIKEAAVQLLNKQGFEMPCKCSKPKSVEPLPLSVRSEIEGRAATIPFLYVVCQKCGMTVTYLTEYLLGKKTLDTILPPDKRMKT